MFRTSPGFAFAASLHVCHAQSLWAIRCFERLSSPEIIPHRHEAGPGIRHRPLLHEQTLCSYPHVSHSTYGSLVLRSSNFQLIINNALDKYKKRTKNDLLAHPLAAQLQSCDSPSAILAVLQQQVQGLDQSRSSDERWSRWLDPTVNVLYAFSSTAWSGCWSGMPQDMQLV